MTEVDRTLQEGPLTIEIFSRVLAKRGAVSHPSCSGRELRVAGRAGL